MKTVYYSFTNDHVNFGFNSEIMQDDFLVLSKDLAAKAIFDKPQANYQKCPAFQAFIKNTYVFKMGFDLDINIQPLTQQLHSNLHPEISSKLLHCMGHNHSAKIMQLHVGVFLFSPEPLSVAQTPCLFQNHSNFKLIPGEYDIGSWFRPINVGFEMENDHIHFKEGDNLFNLKFMTQEKIILKRFEMTDRLYKYAQTCSSFKFISPGRSLKELYYYFQRSRFKNRILKEIESNLI